MKIRPILLLLSLCIFQGIEMTQAASSTANTLTNGLIAYYPFNGDSLDHSGNGKNLTPYGYGFTNGFNGQCLNFISGYNKFNAVPLINRPAWNSTGVGVVGTTTNCSYSIWYNITGTSDRSMYLFNGDYTDSGFLSIDFTHITNQIVSLGHQSSSDGGWSFSPSVNLSTNIWQHIVGTVSGKTFKIYLNGNLVASTTNGVPFAFDPNSFMIGDKVDSKYPVVGMMAEARIYNRALTASEVTSLYNQFRPLPVLVYSLSGAGKLATASTNQSITSSGFFVMSQSNNASSFIWTASSPTKTYSLEYHTNIDSQIAGTGVGATTLYSMASTDGTFPNIEKDLIWLSGTNSLVALNASNTINSPSGMTGFLNTLTLQNGTQIQNESITLTLDKTNTLTALTNGETLNSTISRLTNNLSKQGYSPAQ